MDGTELAALVHGGGQLFTTKLYLTSTVSLWVYDYLLTLGDEVKYAWSGRKSWVFVVFVANRYNPIVYIIWVYVTLFHYNQSFCQTTKWVPIYNATATTVFAQIAVSLRIFAITGKNKYAGGTLALLVVSEFCYGIFSMVWIGLGPLQQFPPLDLDEFKICIYKLWNVGELIYYNSAMAFDILVFSIIIIMSRRPGLGRFPGIPSILDTLVRDATYYFLLIFSGHLLSVLFLFVAPVEIQLCPAMATMLLVPMMASRLMLSLKKASVEPVGMWSLEVMSSSRAGRVAGEGTVRFAPRVPDGSYETSPYSVTLDEEGIELDAKP